MCGIVGYFGEGNETILKKMVEAVHHRGPDDQGIFVHDKLGFGHSRLSIIDLSAAGHQPMLSTTGNTAIVFNGEIYNYLELKSEFEKNNEYKFRGNSDTEIILAMYEKYGESCIGRFSGMFALAIYDLKQSKIVLARDRMGKKPLFWMIADGTLIFGSELTALSRHPKFKKEIDTLSFKKYLAMEYVPGPNTIIKNVQKLEPSTYAVFQNGSISQKRYWSPRYGQNSTINEKKAAYELEKRISDAVRARLISDVPLGVFLSGGLDSSTVAYFAQKGSDKAVHTFSIGFSDKSFDESQYAKKVAEHLGTIHHHKVFVAEDLKAIIRDVFSKMDEPVADGSIIPTYLLSKFARESVTVALGGDGGDELFAGYPTFQAEKLVSFYRSLPLFLRKKIIEPIIKSLPTSYSNFSLDFRLKKFIEGANYPDDERHARWLGANTKEEVERLVSDKVRLETSNRDVYEDVHRHFNENEKTDLGNRLLHVYQRMYMMDEVLVKVDRASMMNSLEVRAPLLDREVVDFADSLPYRLKIKGLDTKYILKKMMVGKLPGDIINRKKKGFGMPVGQWLRSDLKNLCEEALSESAINKTGLLNYSEVKIMKENHYSGRENNYKKLWTILVFMMWYRNFMK